MIKIKYKGSGIYLIKNIVNSRIYIGSSNQIYSRFNSGTGHFNTLKNGTHCNIHLQRAWDKYGPDNFEVEILEKIDKITKEIIREWSSASEAADILKIKSHHITTCCRKKIKSAYGFIWEYKDKGYGKK